SLFHFRKNHKRNYLYHESFRDATIVCMGVEREDGAQPAGATAPPTARAVGFKVSSLGFAIADRFAQTLAPLGLEPREFALMRAVSAAEGQTQQAIAAGLQVP